MMPKYRIVTVEKPPFIMYDEAKKEWSGYCIDMIKYLSGMVEFDYDIVLTPDGKFGSLNDNGVWNGMIRELKDKNADIALGTLSVSSIRDTAVDLTVPYYETVGFSLLMKKKKEETSFYKFIMVLDWVTWLYIFGTFFVTSVLLWLLDRWSPFSYQNNPNKIYENDDKRVFDVKESLWFTMGYLTPQGGGPAPKNLSGRTVAATWWLFGFIVLASYTANLATSITLSRRDPPMESLDALIRADSFIIAPIKDSEAHIYLENMAAIEKLLYTAWKNLILNDSMTEYEQAELNVWDYPISDSEKYTKILENINQKFPENLTDALRRVDNEKFALLGDASDIKYIVQTHCDYRMVGKQFSKKPYALAVQKGSPLKDKLDVAIIKLIQDGTLEKLKNLWWNERINRPKCPREYKISDGITIENMSSIFIILIIGTILAIGTLSLEFWYFRCWLPRTHFKRNPKQKKEKKEKTQQSTKLRKFSVKPVRKIVSEESGNSKRKF